MKPVDRRCSIWSTALHPTGPPSAGCTPYCHRVGRHAAVSAKLPSASATIADFASLPTFPPLIVLVLAAGSGVYCLVDLVRAPAVKRRPKWAWALAR